MGMTTQTHTVPTTPTASTASTGSTVSAASAGGVAPTGSRVDFAKAAPKAFRALIGFDAAAREGLDPALVELVQIRSSQLNGCAYCLHMHTSDARKAGESEERLHMVAVWKDAAHFFTEREQAALALAEAVTLVAHAGVPDDVYARAAAHFDEEELARLLALIFTINTWNRIAISTAKAPGTDERAGR
ncbi:carboxymuconolactone decarboxylase family protein [Streptomyces sp. NPDC006368]|uniref:carboxymuconolactone decarboxylase family protein n=1 Tax=Streptomyces sp. NPDC006368 TaxID=3156760 RepID=UPI0033A2A3C5